MSDRICTDCKHAKPCSRCGQWGCFVHCDIDKMGGIDPYEINTCEFFEGSCDNPTPTYEQLAADNSRLRKAIEDADFHPEYCSVVFKEPCDCGFAEWKRNALEGK